MLSLNKMTPLVGFFRRVEIDHEENVRRETRLTRPRMLREKMNPKDMQSDEELMKM